MVLSSSKNSYSDQYSHHNQDPKCFFHISLLFSQYPPHINVQTGSNKKMPLQDNHKKVISLQGPIWGYHPGSVALTKRSRPKRDRKEKETLFLTSSVSDTRCGLFTVSPLWVI